MTDQVFGRSVMETLIVILTLNTSEREIESTDGGSNGSLSSNSTGRYTDRQGGLSYRWV